MFSIGIVLVSRRSSYTSDLTAFLFGRLLTVTSTQILQTVIVAVVVLAVLTATGKELMLRAFDVEAARAMGYRVSVLDLALNVCVAMVVVAAAQAVGTILVIALLVVPAATGRLIADRIAAIVVIGMVAAVAAGYVGLLASYQASVRWSIRLASGAGVVLALVGIHLLVLLLALAWRWAGRNRIRTSSPEGAR
jgi:manganese/iron transport system permease protein